MGLWEDPVPDLHFQVAGDDFIISLCHTGHIHSLTPLRASPQVTVKAGLCLLQGKVHRDVFPCWTEGDYSSCAALSMGRGERTEHKIIQSWAALSCVFIARPCQ